MTVHAALDEYACPILEARALQLGLVENAAEFAALFREVKRFLLLGARYGKLAMCSPRVDALWHEFILCTADYTAFCETHFGHYVHHAPNVGHAETEPGAAQLERERFVKAYVRNFGPIPPIWHT